MILFNNLFSVVINDLEPGSRLFQFQQFSIVHQVSLGQIETDQFSEWGEKQRLAASVL